MNAGPQAAAPFDCMIVTPSAPSRSTYSLSRGQLAKPCCRASSSWASASFAGRLGLDHDRVLMGRYAFPVISRLLHLASGHFPRSADKAKWAARVRLVTGILIVPLRQAVVLANVSRRRFLQGMSLGGLVLAVGLDPAVQWLGKLRIRRAGRWPGRRAGPGPAGRGS